MINKKQNVLIAYALVMGTAFFTAFSYIFGKKVSEDLYPETVSIKTYYTLTSFGTKTKELKNSVILNYDENEFLVDSSVYSHDISLSEKYVYVVGANEGLKLKREFGKERVLSYQFENDSLGRRIETTLVGPRDSIYWK